MGNNCTLQTSINIIKNKFEAEISFKEEVKKSLRTDSRITGVTVYLSNDTELQIQTVDQVVVYITYKETVELLAKQLYTEYDKTIDTELQIQTVDQVVVYITYKETVELLAKQLYTEYDKTIYLLNYLQQVSSSFDFNFMDMPNVLRSFSLENVVEKPICHDKWRITKHNVFALSWVSLKKKVEHEETNIQYGINKRKHSETFRKGCSS
ncbi:unnamed protein product [Mytilus coruscus]|uniref:Uncharacterized protein n=1 Tax=Mytilus coruscus TaxID=42192 RepID=A0A6J8C301_MYTCO|nr:unnamed protein product [Mytilus coruscus]